MAWVVNFYVTFFENRQKLSGSILCSLITIKQNVRKATRFIFNPFIPNAPFLYPLKTSEKKEKGCIGNRWVNTSLFWMNIDSNSTKLLGNLGLNNKIFVEAFGLSLKSETFSHFEFAIFVTI